MYRCMQTIALQMGKMLRVNRARAFGLVISKMVNGDLGRDGQGSLQVGSARNKWSHE